MVEGGGGGVSWTTPCIGALEDESTAFCAVRAAHLDVDYAVQPHHRTTPPPSSSACVHIRPSGPHAPQLHRCRL